MGKYSVEWVAMEGEYHGVAVGKASRECSPSSTRSVTVACACELELCMVVSEYGKALMSKLVLSR